MFEKIHFLIFMLIFIQFNMKLAATDANNTNEELTTENIDVTPVSISSQPVITLPPNISLKDIPDPCNPKNLHLSSKNKISVPIKIMNLKGRKNIFLFSSNSTKKAYFDINLFNDDGAKTSISYFSEMGWAVGSQSFPERFFNASLTYYVSWTTDECEKGKIKYELNRIENENKPEVKPTLKKILSFLSDVKNPTIVKISSRIDINSDWLVQNCPRAEQNEIIEESKC